MTKEKIGPNWQEIRRAPDNVGKDWIVKDKEDNDEELWNLASTFFPLETDLSIPTVMDAGILEALLGR